MTAGTAVIERAIDGISYTACNHAVCSSDENEVAVMSGSVEQRIARVIANLLPETAIANRFGPAQSLEARMAALHTPGLSIAVINDFAVEWARGFGVCDVRTATPVTPSTLFQAGSISKPIFALAAMRLVQQGRLNLDAHINTYLHSWQIPAHDDWQPSISLRQLLSHSAGLTVHGFPGYQTTELLPSVIQILNGEPPANTAKVEVNILPGLQMRYSGGGTTVAQQAVVDILGTPFPAIMRTLVFEPLDLTNSTYEQPLPSDWAERAATAHPSKGIPLRGGHHIYPEMAAAGLWTTAADLATIGVELLRTIHGASDRLLSPATLEQMLQPQLSQQKVGEGEYAGLGFFCVGKDESFFFGHGGWDEGFVALMRFYRNSGKGAVIMLNSNEGYPLLHEIMRAIGQEYDWPEALPAEKIVIDLPLAERYAGSYTTEAGMTFTIGTLDGVIMLQFGQQPPLPLLSTSEREFFSRALNTSVAFEHDTEGHINRLTIHQEGMTITAKRQNTV
jgi:CubicO group peptidase (beta-lactamase class C family)